MAPSNTLPMHGNEKTMNLNSLVLTNIQSSPYFKVQLYELKTYHQVIDEIYYKVNHLEPWEKGSRKTAGQTGMCGGVRGVGTGGIVSSAFCLLYKLHTMKLTRKQLIGLCNHTDSPYIRALGFMYIRFTQPSSDLWEWFEPYLEDEEELDVKAGGGHVMTIGDMAEHFLTKLDWYSTLFPRIAVPVQKQIEQGLRQHKANKWRNVAAAATAAATAASAATTMDNSVEHPDSYSRANDRNYTGTERTDERDVKRRPDPELESRSSDRHSGRRGSRHRSRSPRRSRSRGCSSRERHHNSHSHRSHEGHRSQEGDRSHSRNQHRRSPPSDRRRSMSRDRSYSRRDKQENSRHRSDRRRTPSGESRGTSHKTEGSHHSRNRHNEPADDFDRELRKEMERIKHEKGIKASGGQQ